MFRISTMYSDSAFSLTAFTELIFRLWFRRLLKYRESIAQLLVERTWIFTAKSPGLFTLDRKSGLWKWCWCWCTHISPESPLHCVWRHASGWPRTEWNKTGEFVVNIHEIWMPLWRGKRILFKFTDRSLHIPLPSGFK